MDPSQSNMEDPKITTDQSTTYDSQVDNIQCLRRPRDATPCSFVGLTNVEEIDTLAPGQELDLQAILHVLERAARLWPGHVYVLDTHILEVLSAVGEDNEMFDEIRYKIAAIPVDGAVLVPLCVGEHHFLFILRKRLHQGASVCHALVYDSILLRRFDDGGINIDPNYWAFVAQRISFLHRSLFSFCAPMQKLVIDLLMCPQQPNEYDCGVAVCLNALDFIAHKGAPSFSTAASACCVAPRFDKIRRVSVASQHVLTKSRVHKLGNLYWSAGRRFVFQLCSRGIARPHANRDALIAARDNVSAKLEALVRSEQAALKVENPPRSPSPDSSAPLPASDEEIAAGKLQRWFESKASLLYLMQTLQDVASNLGTLASRAEDILVFTDAVTVSVHPMHEGQRQKVLETARDNAWHDSGIVQGLFADVTVAKWTLNQVRLPVAWKTQQSGPSLQPSSLQV